MSRRSDESPLERIARVFDHLVLNPIQKGVAVFQCPVCRKKVRTDGAGLSPVCTGPHPSLDEHPMEPMVRVDITGRAGVLL